MGRRVKVPAGGPAEAALLDALRQGNTRTAAAAVVGISRVTLWRMMEDATFCNAVENAEAAAEVARVRQVAKAGEDGSWQAAAWWLERRRHEDYAQRSKVEMSIDIKREAERIAAANGLDPAEVMAEAERVLAGAG